MLKYVARRILYILLVFFVISILMFALFKAIPSDPVLMYMAERTETLKPEQYQALYDLTRERLGLDQPIPIQYLRWMGNLLRGDFGRSLTYRQPVLDAVKTPMLSTIRLNIITMILAFAITIPLGITTAVRKGSIYDNSVQVVTVMGYSLPVFIIALASILLFSVTLRWLPVNGVMTPGLEGTPSEVFWDKALHMVQPVLVLTFASLGSLSRYVRASMIEALRMDYIRTARAKGLREKVVIYSHAFRNSMIPFVTSLVAWFIGLFSGSLMVEKIFLWPGMGKMYVDAIAQLDYAVALALQMFYVILALAGNLIMDLAYTLVDPRVRLS